MRRFDPVRLLVLAAVVSGLLATIAPSTALAQYLRYEATGHLKQFNEVLDAGTTADLNAFGIVAGAAGVGTPFTTTAYVLASQVDSDPDPDSGIYETLTMNIDIGGGIMQASKFRRDADVYIALNVTDIPELPFAADLFGWAGSEPAQSVMPGAFLYNDQAPSPGPPAVPGKGHAVGGVAFHPSAGHPTDALPVTVDLANYIAAPFFLDIVDPTRETVPGTPDTLQLEFVITTLAVTNVPNPIEVPVMGPLGIGLLSAAMAGAGLVSLRLQRRRSA